MDQRLIEGFHQQSAAVKNVESTTTLESSKTTQAQVETLASASLEVDAYL